MNRLIRLFAAAMLTSALAAPALAQSGDGPTTPPTPQQVVQRCVSHMHELTERGVNALRETTQGAVGIINRLDQEGAPDRAILHAGKQARERIGAITRTAVAAINTETGMCLRILRQIEAPQPALEAVLNARRVAVGAVTGAAEHALGAVRSAVQGAIEAPANTTDSAAAIN